MSIQTIYASLVRAGMSPVGACAMMGNMQAESAMRANNAQDGMTGFSDADYTSAADRGTVDFVHDAVGYGLCQWTYHTRKKALLDYARSRGVSVGNEDMQVDFCIQELRNDYSALWSYLCGCTGVYEAAARICKEYERPAVNNIDVRAQFANQFYMTYGEMAVGAPDNAPTGEPEDEIFHTPALEIYWPPRVLEYGMFGGDVVALQGLLTAHGCYVPVSSQFDNKTRAMVMAFQAEKGLSTDGIAGNYTWTALLRR